MPNLWWQGALFFNTAEISERAKFNFWLSVLFSSPATGEYTKIELLWLQIPNSYLLSQTGSSSWEGEILRSSQNWRKRRTQGLSGLFQRRLSWLPCIFYFCWSLLLFVLAFESPTADRPLPSSWALGLQKTQVSIAARKSRAHLSGHGRCECRVIKQCR